VIEPGLADNDLAVLADAVTFIAEQQGADRCRLSIPDGPSGLTRAIDYPPDANGEPSGLSRIEVPVVFEGRPIGRLELVADRADAFDDGAGGKALAFGRILGAMVGDARRQRAKDAFFALTVHELRTPLSAASGFAQTILDHFDRLGPDITRDLLVRIGHNHRRLTRLVDDLVDLLRLEGHQLRVHLCPVDVEPLLDELIRNTDVGTRVVDLRVADGLPHVMADARRLEQVIANLLANAAKFSPPGTRIDIRAAARSGTVDIEIVDQGEGIPPEHHRQIFEAYFQAPGAGGGRPKGLGIGLFLVGRLCELMGASVQVESAPGQGATFTVRLQPA
jgi:signal transduction histidine kinase